MRLQSGKLNVDSSCYVCLNIVNGNSGSVGSKFIMLVMCE